MAVVIMCMCGDETLGIVTPCPRKALYLLVPPFDPLRRLPVCGEHLEALQMAQPAAIALPLVQL